MLGDSRIYLRETNPRRRRMVLRRRLIYSASILGRCMCSLGISLAVEITLPNVHDGDKINLVLEQRGQSLCGIGTFIICHVVNDGLIRHRQIANIGSSSFDTQFPSPFHEVPPSMPGTTHTMYVLLYVIRCRLGLRVTYKYSGRARISFLSLQPSYPLVCWLSRRFSTSTCTTTALSRRSSSWASLVLRRARLSPVLSLLQMVALTIVRATMSVSLARWTHGRGGRWTMRCYRSSR